MYHHLVGSMMVGIISTVYMLLVAHYQKHHVIAMETGTVETFMDNKGFVIILGLCTIVLVVVLVGMYLVGTQLAKLLY